MLRTAQSSWQPNLLKSREPAAKEWGDGGTPSRIRRPLVCTVSLTCQRRNYCSSLLQQSSHSKCDASVANYHSKNAETEHEAMPDRAGGDTFSRGSSCEMSCWADTVSMIPSKELATACTHVQSGLSLHQCPRNLGPKTRCSQTRQCCSLVEWVGRSKQLCETAAGSSAAAKQ